MDPRPIHPNWRASFPSSSFDDLALMMVPKPVKYWGKCCAIRWRGLHIDISIRSGSFLLDTASR